MEPNPHILKHHHITLSVGTAQEDYDFHTKVLGLKSVKKTALYDGDEPIYHLYYGNDLGDESTLITCFPMRQSGRKAPPRDRTDQDTGTVCAALVNAVLGRPAEAARHRDAAQRAIC